MQLAGHWLRSYLLLRARANFKLGHINEALSDCKACIAQYETNKLEDLKLVRCLCLQATVLREQALYAPRAQCVQAYLQCLTLVRRAGEIADALAQASGAFPADSNVTYGRADTAVKAHHMIAPVLQSLIDLHANEPDMALQPQFNQKKLHQHMGIVIPSLGPPPPKPGAAPALPTSTQDKGITTTLARTSIQGSTLHGAASGAEEAEAGQPSAQAFKLSNLRLAPVDRKEGVYCESEFANIYLLENRALLACRTLLCQVLDDARNAGLAGNSAFAAHYEASALINEQLAVGESALKVRNQPLQSIKAFHSSTSRLRAVICKHLHCDSSFTNSILLYVPNSQLARHCVYLPTVLRLSSLVYVSKARIAKKSKCKSQI